MPNPPANPPAAPAIQPDPAAIHASALVIDAHADTPQRFVDESWDFTSPLAIADQPAGHLNLATARRGNLAAEFFALWPDPAQCPGARYALRTLTLLDAVREQVRRHPTELTLCTSPKEILAARAANKFAILLGIEGGHAIENSLALLRLYHALGVRYMTLSWANSNDWAESSGDLRAKAPAGLTPFGREVIAEMNRLGMMVDISHVSDRSFYHALVVSRAPVIASHSSSRAVANHPRNMTDDMLVALARNGGVAQVNFNCGFISDEYNAKTQAFEQAHPAELKHAKELWIAPKTPESQAELDKLMAMKEAVVPRPPLSSLIDHFDHMIKIAGVDHVGIGSDFDGVECLPQGIDGVQDLTKITAELVKRGYTPQDLHKILGGNLLRVFGEVERVSRQIQHEQNPDQRPEVAIPQAK